MTSLIFLDRIKGLEKKEKSKEQGNIFKKEKNWKMLKVFYIGSCKAKNEWGYISWSVCCIENL